MARMSVIDAPDVPEVTLGWRLRMAMERAGLKRDYMAERLGVQKSTITRWTHDEVPVRQIYLERWAELCGVPLAWLESGPFAVVEAGPDTSPGPGRVTGGFSPAMAA